MKYILVSIAACISAPASAELPPQYYDRARDQADDVVLMTIERVGRLENGEVEGNCTMEGTIVAVERGSLYRTGNKPVIHLPCISSGWRPIPGPFPGYFDHVLARALTGRFFLTQGELVLRGYDQLTEREGGATKP